MVNPSPYDVLIGQQLRDGWTVTRRASQTDGGTGGNFSVCYLVERASGEVAFCKVLDFQQALQAADPMAALLQMTSDFQHEVASLEQCKNARMRRVILALESEAKPQPNLPMSLLSYIIFEPAVGDLRAVLPLVFQDNDLAFRFGLLHDATLGVGELHRARISHQDLKPSNILAVAGTGPQHVGKVGDLGRAIVQAHPHRFDAFVFPGDRTYAPPEYMYGHVPPSEDDRRRGTDLYQLGSLISFVLSGVAMPALVTSELDPRLRWNQWSGDYADIEPSLREATERAVELVVEALPDWSHASVRALLLNLCDPDPTRRNALTGGGVNVSRFGLARVLSSLDRLRRIASMKVGA